MLGGAKLKFEPQKGLTRTLIHVLTRWTCSLYILMYYLFLHRDRFHHCLTQSHPSVELHYTIDDDNNTCHDNNTQNVSLQ